MTAVDELAHGADEFPPFDAAELIGENDPGAPGPKPRTRKTRSDAGQARGPRDGSAPRGRQTSTAKLAKDLIPVVAMLGQGAAFLLPTVGAVLITQCDVITGSLAKMAEGNPRLKAALTKSTAIGPSADLIKVVVMCVIAAQLDMQAMDPAHPVAKLSGVSAIHEEMLAEMGLQAQAQEDDGGFGNFNMEPPPMYAGDSYNADGTWSAPPMFAAGPGASVQQ